MSVHTCSFPFHSMVTAVTLTKFWKMRSYKSCIKVIAHNSTVVFKSSVCRRVKTTVICLWILPVISYSGQMALNLDSQLFISSCDFFFLPAPLTLEQTASSLYLPIHPEYFVLVYWSNSYYRWTWEWEIELHNFSANCLFVCDIHPLFPF